MKITIDEKQCLKHHLTIDEVLIVLALRNNKNCAGVFENLIKRGVLVYEDGKYLINQQWSDEIDAILMSSSEAVDEKRLSSLAQKMRELYPKGKMPGTAYFYRCNSREVALKLKKFFATYGNYPDEKILDATKKYVASFQGNYRYLPLIKYFIMKNKTITDEEGVNHISEVSPLADYLENKEDNNLVTASDDWLTTVRN